MLSPFIGEFYCDTEWYSITVQSNSTLEIFRAMAIQSNKVVDEGASDAEYGIISLSESCGSTKVGMDSCYSSSIGKNPLYASPYILISVAE